METRTLLVCGVGSGMDRSLEVLRTAGYDLVVLNQTVRPTMEEVARLVIRCNPEVLPDQAILARIGREGIAGVLALGADTALTVAQFARLLGLPGVSEEVALACTRKDLRISILRNAGLPTPRFEVVDGVDQAFDALSRKVGYPAVVKPLARTGSVGVSQIDTPAQTTDRVLAAMIAGRSCRVILEQYLVGTEHTIGGLSVDGAFFVTGFSDRDYSRKTDFYPHYFESGDTYPSALPADQRTAAIEALRAGVLALGIDNSVVNSDVLIAPDGTVYLLEVTCRMAGARIATEIIPLATGVDVLPNVVRLSMGDSVDFTELDASHSQAVVQRFLPAEPGWVRTIDPIPSSLLACDGIHDVFYVHDLRPGQRLHPYRDATDIIAGAITYGETVEQAATMAQRALDAVPIRIDAEIPASTRRLLDQSSYDP